MKENVLYFAVGFEFCPITSRAKGSNLYSCPSCFWIPVYVSVSHMCCVGGKIMNYMMTYSYFKSVSMKSNVLFVL